MSGYKERTDDASEKEYFKIIKKLYKYIWRKSIQKNLEKCLEKRLQSYQI